MTFPETGNPDAKKTIPVYKLDLQHYIKTLLNDKGIHYFAVFYWGNNSWKGIVFKR